MEEANRVTAILRTNKQKYYLKSVYFTGMDGKDHEIESISPEELERTYNPDMDFRLMLLGEEGSDKKNGRSQPRNRLSQSHR